jgi:hypothetical protein
MVKTITIRLSDDLYSKIIAKLGKEQSNSGKRETLSNYFRSLAIQSLGVEK